MTPPGVLLPRLQQLSVKPSSGRSTGSETMMSPPDGLSKTASPPRTRSWIEMPFARFGGITTSAIRPLLPQGTSARVSGTLARAAIP
jgi:hypothetical protein